jgi:hypothetical protein
VTLETFSFQLISSEARCYPLFHPMEIQQIVSLLVSERDRLSRAIEALGGGARRRGRPPKNDRALTASQPRKRKRKPMTAAQRKAHSTRMKAFWAKRRKAAKS